MKIDNTDKQHRVVSSKYSERIRRDLDKTRAKTLQRVAPSKVSRKRSKSIEKVFERYQKKAEKWIADENHKRELNDLEPNLTISDYIAAKLQRANIETPNGQSTIKSHVFGQAKNSRPGASSNVVQGKTWMSKIDDKPGYPESVSRHLPISLQSPFWMSRLLEFYAKHVVGKNPEVLWKSGKLPLPEDCTQEDAYFFLAELRKVNAVLSGIQTNYKKFCNEQLRELATMIANGEFVNPTGNHIAVRHAKKAWKYIPWENGGPYQRTGIYAPMINSDK